DGVRTYTNRGPVAVTVRLGENPGSPYYYFEGTLHVLDPQTYAPDDASGVVTVPPGGVFSISFALGLGCAEQDAGSAFGIESIELVVTTLGLTRSFDVPLGEAAMVGHTTDYVPPEGCMDDGRPQQPGLPAGW
ncbi:MAG TPA: hypothetical protein VEP72_01845, partial [Microbacterium sp.]|nr:hypothetical protein [Microbacterium sp.]